MPSVALLLQTMGVDVLGWRRTDTHSLSLDGTRISGIRISPDGEERLFSAVIPEPPTAALLALGLLALSGAKRRQDAEI